MMEDKCSSDNYDPEARSFRAQLNKVTLMLIQVNVKVEAMSQ